MVLKFCQVETMGALKIVFALTTMSSLTHCFEKSYSFDIPALMNSFTNVVTLAMSSPRASDDPDSDVEGEAPITGKSAIENLQGVAMGMFSYMANLLSTLSRRLNEMRPNVEMGPGAIKSEIVTYPPNYFVNRLKTLLKIKKKEEAMTKPLN